jgi:predicted DCC family thiol-disulfide oxidoreductase YuxK
MSERVVFFDGVCNLCNGFVQFVIERDPEGRFKFAPLQSEAARVRLGDTVTPGAAPSTVLLFQDGRLHDRSTAALLILRQLRFPWPGMAVLFVVPRPLRDWVYDLIARRRYRWFGRRETCMVPTPDIMKRFL